MFWHVLDGLHTVEGSLDPIGPVARLAVEMGDGDYYNRVVVDAVDYSVQKASQQAPSDSRLDLLRRPTERSD